MSDRRQKKKTARAKKTAAKLAQRRGHIREQLEKARQPDIRRNVHVPRGRPVTLDDIQPHARQKCGSCKGRGLISTRKDEQGKPMFAEPCRCAHVRFVKAHPEIIVTETGEAFWPAEES